MFMAAGSPLHFTMKKGNKKARQMAGLSGIISLNPHIDV
jgi:hypothetical protein